MSSSPLGFEFDTRTEAMMSGNDGGRLGRVRLFFRTLSVGLANKIIRVHDHKGFLEIWWLETPTDDEKQACATLWGSEKFSESENCVEHFVCEPTKVETSVAFEIREGQFYKLADGSVVGPMKWCPESDPFYGAPGWFVARHPALNLTHWNKDGIVIQGGWPQTCNVDREVRVRDTWED